MDAQDLASTTQLLHKNWGLESSSNLDRTMGWEELRAALVVQLHKMLSNDFERLVQAMYRLDVYESKFLDALALPSLDQRAVALADVVLAREVLRAETRRKYSQG